MSKKVMFGTRTIVTLALLVALSIVLTRILAVTAGPYRLSIGSMPIVLSGLLFGPIAGAMTGFVADFLGASLLGTGYTPALMVTPILMGLLPGVLRFVLKNKNQLNVAKLIGVTENSFAITIPKLLIVTAPSYVLGSMLYSTYILSGVVHTPFMALFPMRVLIYVGTMMLDTLLIFLLIKSGVFRTLGYSFVGGNKNELRGNATIHPQR